MQGLVRCAWQSGLGSVGSDIMGLLAGGRIRVVTQSQDLSSCFLHFHLTPFSLSIFTCDFAEKCWPLRPEGRARHTGVSGQVF